MDSDLMKKAKSQKDGQMQLSNAVLQVVNEIIVVVDHELKIVQANGSAKDFLNYDPVGKLIFDLFDNMEIGNVVLQTLKDGSNRRQKVAIEVPCTASFIIKTCYSAVGEGLVVLAMQNPGEATCAPDDLLGNFISDASHEIRTPLTSIIGILETLKKERNQDKTAIDTFLPILDTETYQLRNVINDMFYLFNLRRTPVKPFEDQVDIKEVTEGVRLNLEEEISEKRLKVNIAIKGTIPMVRADVNEIWRMLKELMMNAIFHSDAGKEINIEIGVKEKKSSISDSQSSRITQPKKFVYISITDQGSGIPEEEIAKLTEAFYRVDKSRTRNSKGGTGLGLAIVKRIVELHSGDLEIESKPGVGSKFTTYLLLDNAAHEEKKK
jgi:two-component system phosphate regulon sensor histidine kinase PhoR